MQPLFDGNDWRKDREENFLARLDTLIKAAAADAPEGLSRARLDLANFYMARGMFHEARGVTNLILSETKAGSEDAAVVKVGSRSTPSAPSGLRDLGNPAIGNGYDPNVEGAGVRASGQMGGCARSSRTPNSSIAALPMEMQRIVTACDVGLARGEGRGASRRPQRTRCDRRAQEMKPEVAVLRGRLAEALGHDKDALDAYKFAANSSDRPSAAEGRLLEVLLRQKRGELPQADALRELETLSAIWRGDGIEVKTLAVMAQIYADVGRYSESFAATGLRRGCSRDSN